MTCFGENRIYRLRNGRKLILANRVVNNGDLLFQATGGCGQVVNTVLRSRDALRCPWGSLNRNFCLKNFFYRAGKK